ncbi:MAG: hypothetical protein ACFE0R_08185 [Salinarimonas sp.]
MSGEKTEQQKAAEKALEMKRKNDPHAHVPEHRTSDKGMQPNEAPPGPPSGALDHEGAAPAQSRSHGARQSDQG